MTDQPPPPSSPPAGWYPDGQMPGFYRWWDGFAWTDRMQAVELAPPAHQQPVHTPAGYPPSPTRSQPTTPYPLSSVPYPQDAPSHPPLPMYNGGQPRTRNMLATWSLILGILGLLGFWVPFVGLALGAVALTFGIIGIRRSRAAGRGRGPAIAGIVTGALAAAIGLALTIFVVTFQPETAGVPAAPSVTAAPTDAAAPSESAAPSETTADEMSGAEQAEFVLDSRNDLADFGKDLDDMIVTLDEDGFWRLLSNSVELSFNHAQLAGRTAPPSIATEWAGQLAVLNDDITQIDGAIEDERYDELRTIIAAADNHLVALGGILDKVDE